MSTPQNIAIRFGGFFEKGTPLFFQFTDSWSLLAGQFNGLTDGRTHSVVEMRWAI